MHGTAYGYVFREPVRMQVLLPGHDPVEVRAYATIDARMQAASLLNVDIAEALEAKVAVETAALRRWQKRQKGKAGRGTGQRSGIVLPARAAGRK